MTAWHNFHDLINFELFVVGGTPVTLASIGTFVIAVIVAMLISRSVQRVATAAIRRRGLESDGTVGVVLRLLHYVFLAIGIGIGLQTIGIRLSALFAAGAVFAVGIGFAMQNIAQNFVSGVILLLERSIKPGDILEIEGQVVRVREMGIRAAIVRTLSDDELIVPNSILVQSTVKNFTLSDRSIRVRVEVGVAYESDLRKTIEALTRAAATVEERVASNESVVLIRGFGSSSVDFEVSIWIDNPWRVDRVKHALRLAMWDALEEDEITISFPQLDVHLDTDVIASLDSAA